MFLQVSAALTHKRGKWVIFHCVDALASSACSCNERRTACRLNCNNSNLQFILRLGVMSFCLRTERNKLFLSPWGDPVLFQTRSVIGERHNRYYSRNNTLNTDNSRNCESLRSWVRRALLTSLFVFCDTSDVEVESKWKGTLPDAYWKWHALPYLQLQGMEWSCWKRRTTFAVGSSQYK